MPVTRRLLLDFGSAGIVLIFGGVFPAGTARAQDDGMDAVENILGRAAMDSDRLRLDLPAVFPNGSTVPLSLEIDTAMTAEDHVRDVRLFAPRNPIVEIMAFRFEPGLGVPHVATRIRLSEPQFVVAVAEMNDGSLLMARQFVDVATNGCATE